MLTTPEAPSFPLELRRALDAEGEEEYRQLLRVVRAGAGRLLLFLIESDFTPAARDVLLHCLRADLDISGLHLRSITLTAEDWDVFRLAGLETPAAPDEAIALVGLEYTPGLVREPGHKSERPPIYALLNRLRETLHARLPAPFLVWCTPGVYTGLQTHAPDFFDHYAGLFQFMDANPNIAPDRLPTAMGLDTRQLLTPLSPVAARSAVAFYEQQVTQHSDPTSERAHFLLGLANALMELRGSDYSQHVQRALCAVEEALALLSSEHDAYQWARGQIIKGIVYSDLSSGNQTQNMQQAIACSEAALRIFTETDFPYEWAKAQNSLGNVYSGLPIGDREANLQQAIACYEAALRVRTEADYPQEWAGTQHNLGIVYHNLTTGDQAQNLLRAISYYENALRVYTESEFPYSWANTQYNLGNVYSDLPIGNREANLQQAIACYEAALRVRTEANYPREWAGTQGNLGTVYHNLTTGDQAQNLLRAVECYEAALRVCSESYFPQVWVNMQCNLALVQEDLGNRKAARLAWHRAAIGYLLVGQDMEAEQAERRLRWLGDA